MKKLYCLLAIASVLLAACNPLSKTYQTLDAVPNTNTLKISLIASDYATLATGVTAKTTQNFKSATDANTYIPTILNVKYASTANNTSASVTFNLAPSSSNVNVPDSTFTHVAYTLLTTDYTFPGNTFADLSASGILNYLAYKYPTAADNQLAVITYVYFESGATPSAGATVTDSFLYLKGSWTKVYTVSPAQYTSVNRGTNNWFLASDIPNLANYINTFLKTDPLVSATAKAGDVKYVSYRYTTTYQKIMTLTYDGTNWAEKQTLSYLKLGGLWLPDPTVYVTEPDAPGADYTYLATTTIGTANGRTNIAQYGDFNVTSSSTYYWSDADITLAFAAILLHRFPAPAVGVPYKVTYYVYPTAVQTKTYVYNGTAFVLQ